MRDHGNNLATERSGDHDGWHWLCQCAANRRLASFWSAGDVPRITNTHLADISSMELAAPPEDKHWAGRLEEKARGVILEGIVTTLDEDRAVRITPMGPSVEGDFQRLIFRPFTTSRTFQNLKRAKEGVFHVTDDVELLAHAAVNQLASLPPLKAAEGVDGFILVDACRWYAFRVELLQEAAPRATMVCRVVGSAVEREFFGFNRAKHAVVEAAILATRVSMIDHRELRDELARLEPLVAKTGGPAEERAFAFLKDYIHSASKS